MRKTPTSVLVAIVGLFVAAAAALVLAIVSVGVMFNADGMGILALPAYILLLVCEVVIIAGILSCVRGLSRGVSKSRTVATVFSLIGVAFGIALVVMFGFPETPLFDVRVLAPAVLALASALAFVMLVFVPAARTFFAGSGDPRK